MSGLNPVGPRRSDDAIKLIASALERLRFGAISLVVHEGKVTQVEVTERRRFQNS